MTAQNWHEHVLSYATPTQGGESTALATIPDRAKCLLILGHGSGAGMRHPWLQELANALAARQVAVLRYQFPYMDQGKSFPDKPQILLDRIGTVIEFAAVKFPDLPHFAGGKSLGGRMTSNWVAQYGPGALQGLVFFGFPLHPPGKEGVARGDHLKELELPLLFHQGGRDKLARPDLINTLCAELGAPTELNFNEAADHGFQVLKRSGQTSEAVLENLAEVSGRWMRHWIKTT